MGGWLRSLSYRPGAAELRGSSRSAQGFEDGEAVNN